MNVKNHAHDLVKANTINTLTNIGITKGLVIGSICHPELMNKHSDIDIIVHINDIPNELIKQGKIITVKRDDPTVRNVEIHVATDENYLSTILYENTQRIVVDSYILNTRYSLNTNHSIEFANTSLLYAFKASHINYEHRKWNKHIYDYHVLRKEMGEVLAGIVDDTPQLAELKKYQEEINGKQHKISLNKHKDAFFNDNVIQYFDYDYLHEILAHYERPMYERLQYADDEVMCRKELWYKLSTLEKMQCVLEECYVIACERILIPHIIKNENFHYNSSKALYWALMRVCTTLTSGWFREFAVNNYYEIVDCMNHDYHNKIKFLFDDGFDIKQI